MAAMRSVKTLVASLAVAPSCTGFRSSRSKRQHDEYTIYEGKPLMEITMCKQSDIDVLSPLIENRACTLLEDDELALKSDAICFEVPVICSTSAAKTISDELGLAAARVMSRDAAEFYRVVSGSVEPALGIQAVGDANDAFYTNWRDYPSRIARVKEIVAASNGAAELISIGKSFEGRDINVVRMTGAGYVKGGPRLVVTGNIHAREWIGGMSTLYGLEQLAIKAGNDKNFLAGIQVDIVPIANPDGFVYTTTSERFHRKNMRPVGSCFGVDNNRNFNISWGTAGSYDMPCIDTYHGAGPNSEPETLAIVGLMEEAPMTVFIDIHAFSQLVLTAYSYTKANHPRKAEYAAVGGLMKKAIDGKFGKVYKMGPTAQTLYAASGSTLDYADKLGALGFCWELRPASAWGATGFAPPPSEILPTAQETHAGLLATIDFVKSKAR